MNVTQPPHVFPACTADALTDAAPIRLSHIVEFDASHHGSLPPCANSSDRIRASYRRNYLPAQPDPARFRVR